MKKTILTIALVTLGALVLVMPTLAATTVSFSPASINIKPGKNFNVSIVVNPQNTNNYAEKVEMKYPADMLQVNSFTMAGTWMALTQPGYDLVDNTNGVLIKSAGYPGGFSSATTFGTVSFYAKKAGSGTITIGNNSLAFEINSQSALSGTPASFTITAPAVIVPKPSTTKNPVAVPSKNKPPTTNVAPVKQPDEQPIAQIVAPANTSLTAAIGGLLTLGTGSVLVGVLAVIIIFAIVVYLIYALVQRKK